MSNNLWTDYSSFIKCHRKCQQCKSECLRMEQCEWDECPIKQLLSPSAYIWSSRHQAEMTYVWVWLQFMTLWLIDWLIVLFRCQHRRGTGSWHSRSKTRQTPLHQTKGDWRVLNHIDNRGVDSIDRIDRVDRDIDLCLLLLIDRAVILNQKKPIVNIRYGEFSVRCVCTLELFGSMLMKVHNYLPKCDELWFL